MIPVSAATRRGDRRACWTRLAEGLVDPRRAAITAYLPAGDGSEEALAPWLYRHGRIVDRIDGEDGTVRLSVRLDNQALGRFERLFPDALTSEAAE